MEAKDDMTTWRDQKKRHEQYQARKEQLPASYLEAIEAMERYALRFGPATRETVVTMEQQRLARTIHHAERAGA